MDNLRLLLVAGSIALVFILMRALWSGNIHSKCGVTHRDENPGTFWVLWFVLLLPLVSILMLVTRLKGHH